MLVAVSYKSNATMHLSASIFSDQPCWAFYEYYLVIVRGKPITWDTH